MSLQNIHNTTNTENKEINTVANQQSSAETGTIDILIPDFLPSNPKITFFEDRVSALEGGTGAVAFKSIDDAYSNFFHSILSKGDNVISFNSKKLNLQYRKLFKNIGSEVRYISDKKLTSLLKQIDDNTKAIYIETFGSEDYYIPDFQKINAIGRDFDIPVIVDNSGSYLGYFSRPFFYGASVILENIDPVLLDDQPDFRAIVIDSGKFNWQNTRYTKINQYVDQLGKNNYSNFSFIDYLREESKLNNQINSIPSDALSLVKKLDTIFPTIQEQANNTFHIAKWLVDQKEVSEVLYPGLSLHHSHFTALTFFRNGFGTELSFSVKGGAKNFEIFASRLVQYNTPKAFKVEFDVESFQIKIKVGNTSTDLVKEVINNAFRHIKVKQNIHLHDNALLALAAIQ